MGARGKFSLRLAIAFYSRDGDDDDDDQETTTIACACILITTVGELGGGPLIFATRRDVGCHAIFCRSAESTRECEGTSMQQLKRTVPPRDFSDFLDGISRTTRPGNPFCAIVSTRGACARAVASRETRGRKSSVLNEIISICRAANGQAYI